MGTTQNSSQIPLGFHCQITIFFIWNTQVCKRRVIFQLIWVSTIVATSYPKFQPNSAQISLSNHHFLHLEHKSLQAQGDFSIDLGRYYCCNNSTYPNQLKNHPALANSYVPNEENGDLTMKSERNLAGILGSMLQQ